MNSILYILIQISVTLLAAPLISGIIKKIKALSQKRKGPPLLQLYYDLYKLCRKRSVVSEVSSWIFRAAPYVVFSTALAAALLAPVSTRILPPSIPGDLILLVSLLALGRFFLMLSALDTASAFGGMGSSREAMVSSLIEPSILVSLFTVALVSGSTSIPQMMAAMKGTSLPLLHPMYIMAFFALLIITVAETARIPVDDPATHLELTMIHEAMVLEYSGRHLALMELGAAVKQQVFLTLTANLLIPHDQWIGIAGAGGVVLSLLLYLAKAALLAALIALAEISTVKLRFFSIPNLAALAFILSFLGLIQFLITGGGHVLF